MQYSYIKIVVKHIVELLVDKRYQELYDNDAAKEVTPEIMVELLEGWGRLILPPEHAFDTIEVYETDDLSKVAVNFNLWFEDHKDVTLLCIIHEGKQQNYTIEDIHML
jgi:hypothetical protein